MEIIRDEEKKLIQIWLNRQERQDVAVAHRLKDLYAQGKREHYLVAVYQSGNQN